MGGGKCVLITNGKIISGMANINSDHLYLFYIIQAKDLFHVRRSAKYVISVV